MSSREVKQEVSDDVKGAKLQDFFEKQRSLKSRWDDSWVEASKSKQEDEKPHSDPPASAPTKCAGLRGEPCSNFGEYEISGSKIHFILNYCNRCFQSTEYNVPEEKLVAGIVVTRRTSDGVVIRVEGKLDAKVKPKRPKSNPNSPVEGKVKPTSSFLFNGQGAQYIGMTESVKDLPEVKDIWRRANKVLGYDLQSLVLSGSPEQLQTTVYSQPAMLVAGLCAAEKLKSENPSAFAKCTAAAGLSLGEYTALVFAGALSLEDALAIVKARAEAMDAAAKKTRGVMFSIVGLDEKVVRGLCDEAVKAYPGQICTIANMLFPQGYAVSGHEQAVVAASEAAQRGGAKKVSKLFVSGAFHTLLMEPARDALVPALKKATIQMPRIPVYSNVTGRPFASIDEIREGLATQLCAPVRWEQSVAQMIKDGHKSLFELAPRANAIKAMVRQIDREAHKTFQIVPV